MKIEIIRSRRKTIAIQIKPDLSVVVRAPYGISKREINEFVERKYDWIERKLQEMSRRKEEQKNHSHLTEAQVKELARKALEYIPSRVEYYAPIVGVDYNRITIRNQKTRWGSCSSKGNLNFNCFLMMAPPDVIDYVVVHELCHRKQMNHSKEFWDEVASVCPEYKEARNWLKEHGTLISYE